MITCRQLRIASLALALALAGCVQASVQPPSTSARTASTPTDEAWSELPMRDLGTRNVYPNDCHADGDRVCVIDEGVRGCVRGDEVVSIADEWLDDEAIFAGCVGNSCLFVDVRRAVAYAADDFTGSLRVVGEPLATSLRVASRGVDDVVVLLGQNGAYRFDGRALARFPIDDRLLDVEFLDASFGAALIEPGVVLVTHDGGRSFAPADVPGRFAYLERGVDALIVTPMEDARSGDEDDAFDEDEDEDEELLEASEDEDDDRGAFLLRPGGASPTSGPIERAPRSISFDPPFVAGLVRDAALGAIGFGERTIPTVGRTILTTSRSIGAALRERVVAAGFDLEDDGECIAGSRGRGYVLACGGGNGEHLLVDAAGRVVGSWSGGVTRVVVDATGDRFVTTGFESDAEEAEVHVVERGRDRVVRVPSGIGWSSVLGLVGDQLVVGGRTCETTLCGDAALVRIDLSDDVATVHPIAIRGETDFRIVRSRSRYVQSRDLDGLESVASSDGTLHVLVDAPRSPKLLVGLVTGPLEVIELPRGIGQVAFMDAGHGVALSTEVDGVFVTSDGGRTFEHRDVPVDRLPFDVSRRSHSGDAPFPDLRRPWTPDDPPEEEDEPVFQALTGLEAATYVTCSDSGCAARSRAFLRGHLPSRVREVTEARIAPVHRELSEFADVSRPWRGYRRPSAPRAVPVPAFESPTDDRESALFEVYVGGMGRLVVARADRDAPRARFRFEGIASSGDRIRLDAPSVRWPARRPFVQSLAASERLLLVRFSGVNGVAPVDLAILRDGRTVPVRGLPSEFEVVASTELPGGGLAMLVEHYRIAHLIVVDARGVAVQHAPTRVDDGKVLALVRRGADVAIGIVDGDSGAIAVDGPAAERIAVDWSAVPACATPPTERSVEVFGAFPPVQRHSWEHDEGSITAVSVVDGRACLRWFLEPGSRGRPDDDPPRRFVPGAHSIGVAIAPTGIAELRDLESEAVASVSEPRIAFARLTQIDGRTELLVERSETRAGRTVLTTEPVDDANGRPTIVGILPTAVGRHGADDFLPGRFADGSFRTPHGDGLPRDGSCARVSRRDDPVVVERLTSPSRAFVVRDGRLAIGSGSDGFAVDVVGTVARVEGPASTFVALAGRRHARYADMGWTVPQLDLVEVDRSGAIAHASLHEMGSFHLASTLALAVVGGTPYVAVGDENGHAIRFFVRARGRLVRALPPLAVATESPAVLAWSGPEGTLAILDTPIASRRPYLRVLRHDTSGWRDVVPPLALVLDSFVVGVPDARFVDGVLLAAVPRGTEGFDVVRVGATGWETVHTHRFADVVVPDDVCDRVRAEARAEAKARERAEDERGDDEP